MLTTPTVIHAPADISRIRVATTCAARAPTTRAAVPTAALPVSRWINGAAYVKVVAIVRPPPMSPAAPFIM